MGDSYPSARDLLDNWIDELDPHDMVSSKEAKKEYFLTASDLATLFYEPVGGGVGIGSATKYYIHRHLVNRSLRKHGMAGVVKKLEARNKREEKKRMKEEQAEQARNRLMAAASTSTTEMTHIGRVTTTNIRIPRDSQEIKNLRGGLLNMVKENMGFRTTGVIILPYYYGGAPKNWRIEMPGISKATFAALIFRPTDVDLESFVKNGAYYTEKYEASNFFGVHETKLTKYFNRECVTQKIGSTVTVRYKPSTMELSISGYAEIFGR
jgi:hypothetical protein